MQQVLMFELGGASFALKLEAVDRILAPGESLPSGCRPRELADLLERERPVERHALVLAGGREALLIGRPQGSITIQPSWILPMPGYMFRTRRVPVRGIIEITPGQAAKAHLGRQARRCMMIDVDFLLDDGLESC